MTKDGIRVEVGQVWRDLDKRNPYRKRKIIVLDQDKGKVLMICVHYSSPATWVSVRRMHKHSTGWELVTK